MTVGKEVNGDNEVNNVPSGRFGMRHLQVFLMLLGMIIGYCLRVGMSVAIVPMSNSTSSNSNSDAFGWDSSERSAILSSFFVGYTIMQIPSGYIADVWSAQKLLSIGLLICGVSNMLIPIAARYGDVIAVCACRVAMGLSQACLLPCTHTLLSKWAPPSERARLATFAYAGAPLGTVIALPIAGVLAGSNFGWPSIFYLFGALALIWSIAAFLYLSDTPSKHPSISEDEKCYIERSLRVDQESEAGSDQKKLSTPWKAIFTSLPMWAIIIAHCGQNWGYWLLLTEMPTYMGDVLKFNIEENGGLSSLPYLTMWLLSFPASWLSDYALKKGLPKVIIRKVCNTISHWGPAVALLILAITQTKDRVWVVVILVIAVGINASSLCGFQINHIDLSPNFAGTMMAITNCIAAIVAIIAPIICGAIITDTADSSQWSIVFYVSVVIYFVGNLFFVCFGRAEIQWWNDSENPKDSSQVHKKSGKV